MLYGANAVSEENREALITFTRYSYSLCQQAVIP
jgi:hypothetical protein